MYTAQHEDCLLNRFCIAPDLKVHHQRRRQSTGTRGPWAVLGGTWRARRARAYNGCLGAEPPAGFRGRAPGQGVRGSRAGTKPP